MLNIFKKDIIKAYQIINNLLINLNQFLQELLIANIMRKTNSIYKNICKNDKLMNYNYFKFQNIQIIRYIFNQMNSNEEMVEQQKQNEQEQINLQNQQIENAELMINNEVNFASRQLQNDVGNIEQEQNKNNQQIQQVGQENIQMHNEQQNIDNQPIINDPNQQKVQQQIQPEQYKPQNQNQNLQQQNINNQIQNQQNLQEQNIQKQDIEQIQQQQIINQDNNNNKFIQDDQVVEEQDPNLIVQIIENNQMNQDKNYNNNQMSNEDNQVNNVDVNDGNGNISQHNLQEEERYQPQLQAQQENKQAQRQEEGSHRQLQHQQQQNQVQGQQQRSEGQQQLQSRQQQRQQQKLIQRQQYIRKENELKSRNEQKLLLQKQKQNQLFFQKQKQEVINNLMLKFNQQNQSYLNNLQRKLDNLKRQLQNSTIKNEQLQYKVKAITQQSQKNKNMILELRKIKLQLDKQNKKLTKQLQKYKKQSNQFKQKLIQVQKIGNVFSIKQKVEELQILTDIQNQEILQLKNNLEQAKNNQSKEEEHVLFFKRLQNQLTLSKDEINKLHHFNADLQGRLLQAHSEKQRIEEKQVRSQETISILRQQKEGLEWQLRQWQIKWQSLEEERHQIRRLKELDQSVLQYESSRNMGQQTNIPKINFLSDKEEKQILLKEYLMMETQYQKVKRNLQLSQKKIKAIQRQNKHKQSNFIRKKDYLDLAAKYKKAKICLQQTFIKLKRRSQHENITNQIREEINQLLQGNQAKLCQNVIRQTTQHLKYITEKTNYIEINDQISSLKYQNKKLSQKNIAIQKQMKSNEKVMFLLNDQVELKKKIIAEKTKMIDQLINNGYSYNNGHYEDKIFRYKNQIQALRQELIIYQSKNILLIKENSSFLAQINHWKELYNSIKQNFVQKINNEHEPSRLLQSNNQHFYNDYYNRQAQIRYEPPIQIETQSFQCQTENLYDLHYKEIKQSLMVLKNLKSKIQSIPQISDKNSKLVLEFKQKYEKVLQKYNGKLMQLQKEKSQNDNWRSKVKEEIKLQFQDIRQLIANNRLVTALRQAKSLIEYLENEQQKMNVEEEMGKGQQNEEEINIQVQNKNIE